MVAAIQLQTKRIEGSAPGPHLLITGGVHGDEFEPMAAVRRLMGQVDASGLRGGLTLVPVVNEAAFLRGHRMAEDELDLARVCPGSADGSVTERTAWALSELIRAADFYIDLHTGGTTMSVLPMAGYSLHKNRDILDTQRRMAHAFNLPIVWGTSGELDGRSLSVARDENVPAIYTEYHGSGTCDPDGITAYVDGCLNVMGELGMIDRKPPRSIIEHVVEDARPQSGYMQIQNPSPMTGFFEPAVRLNDPVKPGDLIGTICDVPGERVERIESRQNGIVLTLKTFSRVLEGEGLAVILATG